MKVSYGALSERILSWGVFVFLGLTAACYIQAIYRRNGIYSDLSSRLKQMEEKKNAMIQEREELECRLQAASDPAWMELVLMKELGMVPEGWTKVRFQKDLK